MFLQSFWSRRNRPEPRRTNSINNTSDLEAEINIQSAQHIAPQNSQSIQNNQNTSGIHNKSGALAKTVIDFKRGF